MTNEFERIEALHRGRTGQLAAGEHTRLDFFSDKDDA